MKKQIRTGGIGFYLGERQRNRCGCLRGEVVPDGRKAGIAGNVKRFRGFRRGFRFFLRQRHFTDEIEINLDLLVVLIAVDLPALIDDHLVNELIEHGRGQLGKVRIAVYQLHEAVNIDAFFLFCVHLLHQLGAALLKLCLFRFILRGELCVPLLRQTSEARWRRHSSAA